MERYSAVSGERLVQPADESVRLGTGLRQADQPVDHRRPGHPGREPARFGGVFCRQFSVLQQGVNRRQSGLDERAARRGIGRARKPFDRRAVVSEFELDLSAEQAPKTEIVVFRAEPDRIANVFERLSSRPIRDRTCPICA